ncbi:unnamed protein product [Caenorhabditis bovis]|uniref:Eukaryotic membrane protein n=1 Tax=Caenorhabditis bovis TaxID=2654633 RepID=A0A8S1EG75_9PELO|nr:unnamed protein product [Caenorhabditis bovis]
MDDIRRQPRDSVSSETSSIHDLQNIEANDLSSTINDEIATQSAPPSPEAATKTPTSGVGNELDQETPKRQVSVLRRRLRINQSDENEKSELENEQRTRKTSRISYADRLTVICDNNCYTPECSPPQTPSPNRVVDDAVDFQPKTFLPYLFEELTRGYSLHNDHARFSEKRRKIYAFLRIPLELERFLSYGLLQCIDAFFYLFTFLPLRFLMSLCGFVLRIKRWTSAETCDVIKVIIILSASMLIREIDSSILYHQVKSQSVIKLYIFYNMLEVADRLFSSLGQDILDALFWTANSERLTIRNSFRMLVHLIVAIFYATLHTFLVILQATTLNVAFNSHNQALLAIMMSNNFVELKGSVFKKFAKANLFQMACSDVRERFHIFALLFVVMIRNMVAVNWNVESLGEMIPDMIMVIGAELLVDWLKHAFITKFNEINAEVYKDFTITIAFDVIRSREQTAVSDYSDQVSRRMGFIPIPLSIMMIRVLSQTFSIENRLSLFICFIGWLIVFLVKIFNGIVMVGMACQHVKKFREYQTRSEYELIRKRMLEKKSKSAPNSPRMSLIDFSDVLHQPAAGKGFTVSDVLQWDEYQPSPLVEPRRSSERETSGTLLKADDRAPRRALSMANILSKEQKALSVEESATPAASEEPTTPQTSAEQSGQLSPKKKIAPTPVANGGELADTMAYTMPEQGIQRIE